MAESQLGPRAAAQHWLEALNLTASLAEIRQALELLRIPCRPLLQVLHPLWTPLRDRLMTLSLRVRLKLNVHASFLLRPQNLLVAHVPTQRHLPPSCVHVLIRTPVRSAAQALRQWTDLLAPLGLSVNATKKPRCGRQVELCQTTLSSSPANVMHQQTVSLCVSHDLPVRNPVSYLTHVLDTMGTNSVPPHRDPSSAGGGSLPFPAARPLHPLVAFSIFPSISKFLFTSCALLSHKVGCNSAAWRPRLLCASYPGLLPYMMHRSLTIPCA